MTSNQYPNKLVSILPHQSPSGRPLVPDLTPSGIELVSMLGIFPSFHARAILHCCSGAEEHIHLIKFSLAFEISTQPYYLIKHSSFGVPHRDNRGSQKVTTGCTNKEEEEEKNPVLYDPWIREPLQEMEERFSYGCHIRARRGGGGVSVSAWRLIRKNHKETALLGWNMLNSVS